MNIKHLLTFIKVAELKNFTKTAKELNYSQSTISFHIQNLEKELNITLFDRSGKQLVLTAEGDKILDSCKVLRDNYYQLLDLSSSITDFKTPIHIATVESVLIYKLSHIVREYRNQYPMVNIQLNSGDTSEYPSLIHDALVDFAFFIEPDILDPDIELIHLSREPMYLIYPNNHSYTSLHDLTETLTTCITEKGCAYRQVLYDYHTNHLIQPKATIESGSIDMIKHCVTSGIGYSILPKMCIEEELKNHSFQYLQLDERQYYIDLTLGYKKNRLLTAHQSHFVDLVTAAIRK